jgi:hypothetical protein
MDKSLKRLTVITYLHPNEVNLSRCIAGLKKQSIEFEWILLTHNKEINTGINCRLITLPKGITNKAEAYNFILPKITSKYIAYNDADDISINNRFSIQIDYLEQNKEIDILGGNLLINGAVAGWPIYQNNDDIGAYFILNNPMVNSSVMLRNTGIKWGVDVKYNENLSRAEDYDFWLSCWKNKYHFKNLSLPLIDYYLNSGDKATETFYARKIRMDAVKLILQKPIEEEEQFHLFAEKKLSNELEHKRMVNFILELSCNKNIEKIIKSHTYQKSTFWQKIKKHIFF